MSDADVAIFLIAAIAVLGVMVIVAALDSKFRGPR